MEKHHDIVRLGKIITHLKACEDLFYQMDEKEYRRMRDYICNRFGTNFPFDNPAVFSKIPSE